MAKARIDRLAKEWGMDVDSLLLLANEKLADEMMSGRLKTTWVDEEGQKILKDATN